MGHVVNKNPTIWDEIEALVLQSKNTIVNHVKHNKEGNWNYVYKRHDHEKKNLDSSCRSFQKKCFQKPVSREQRKLLKYSAFVVNLLIQTGKKWLSVFFSISF